MKNSGSEQTEALASFGRRKVVPRVCVVDGKKHIRTFLSEVLQDLGFITCECEMSCELGAILKAQQPDLVVLGLSAGSVAATETLQVLATKKFEGTVLLLGPRPLPMVGALQELGQRLGLAMLPPLHTPFGPEALRESARALLPVQGPPRSPVDVAEAISAGWLELWYQPKLDVRAVTVSGVEALIRINHPYWGIVTPAYFIPDDGDPLSRALSAFVIGQAIEDWHYFLSQYGPVEISINLPIAFLEDSELVEELCHNLPKHPAFAGMIVEINGTELIGNMALAKDVARRLRFHNIAISVDDLGAEWPQLMAVHNFPFAEIKVDQKFVAGCADDRLKQTVCRKILELADHFGARTVAEGVETRADFLMVRKMGFALAQGYLFAKPMVAKKLVQTMLRQS